ncbi:MAG: GyrI-like domain-containing protein [Thermoanaerobaculia bacterium]
MDQQISLTRVQPHYTAVVRGQVQAARLAQFVTAACGEVWAFIRAAGAPTPGRNIALNLANGSIEAGVEVSAPFHGNGRVVCSQTPGGLVATAGHLGPYHRLGDAHRSVRQWCASHGHQATAVSWERYGHWLPEWNADPSKILTDIFILVREAS